MPRINKTPNLAKVVGRRTPTSKTIEFTFEGEACKVEVSPHDSATILFDAFSRAVGGIKTIKIIDEKGVNLRLGYANIKNNGKVYVERINKPTQGHLAEGAARQKIYDLLVKIIADWELQSADQIFPTDCAPREKSFTGQMATWFDADVPFVQPLAWSVKFVAILAQLSKRTKGRHAEATEMIKDVASRRFKDRSHWQWGIAGIMTQDISSVVEKLNDNAENLAIAADTVNVVESKVWKGDLDDAIERVEEGTDIEGREEDSTATHHVLAMR